MKNRNLLVALVVSIAFVIGTVWAAQKFARRNRAAQEITVTGNASRELISDIIVWEASYETTANDIKEGFKVIAQDQQAVQQYLKEKGVADSAITFSSVTFDKQYEQNYINGQYVSHFTGYKLTQKVRIVSSRVNAIEQVSRQISELLDQNVMISSEPPRYYYSKLEESKHELLKAASQDAYERAQAIAEGSNRHIGKLRNSQMGVFQIVGLYSQEDYGWGGTFNTSSRVKTISVTVRNSYSVN